MEKYNYHQKKEKVAAYRTLVKPEVMDEIYEQILKKMVVEKKYRDPNYSAKLLANEIGTNTRYISATVNLRFQMNYSELVNGYRIRDAMYMLTDRRNRNMTMGEVATAVGFSNRQSFYSSFYHIQKQTPREYQMAFFAKMKQAGREPKESKAKA